MIFRLAAILLVLIAPALAQALSAEKIRVIDRLVTADMSRESIPGMSIAIAAGDQIWSAGYGLTDIENFVPVKAYSMYRLASISKPITATAVMQLVEKGKIDLDAPVQKYVPEFPAKQWPVTVRQLLGHLGGVRHYRDDAESSTTKHYGSIKEALSAFKDDPLALEPGTKYSYTVGQPRTTPVAFNLAHSASQDAREPASVLIGKPLPTLGSSPRAGFFRDMR